MSADGRYLLSYEVQSYAKPTPMQIDKERILEQASDLEFTDLDEWTVYFEMPKYTLLSQTVHALYADKVFEAVDGDPFSEVVRVVEEKSDRANREPVVNKHKHPPTPTIEEQLDAILAVYRDRVSAADDELETSSDPEVRHNWHKLASEMKFASSEAKTALILLITKAEQSALQKRLDDYIKDNPSELPMMVAMLIYNFTMEDTNADKVTFTLDGFNKHGKILGDLTVKAQLKATTQKDT